jgi:superfamily II DNA or RNA helicase
MVVNMQKGTARIILQDIADSIDFHSDLPPSWSTFNNFVSFSKRKTLFDYQEEALKNSIKILYFYFQSAEDYRVDEPLELNDKRKTRLLEEYERRGLEPALLQINESKSKKIFQILSEFFETKGNSIPFKNLINRMTFWMATGSGKTLVIVKLIEILNTLMRRGEIPPYDILILTCREDLVGKMEEYIKEYNEHNILKIRLWSLKDFNKVKYGGVLPRGENSIDVFLYRSDLISDEEKEKFVNFKNYENGGKWYILLDEAHKGDKEESKRQALYSIMSRNGFLFNFSATFTHPMDIYTTVYNINLAQYVGRGYGKNIYVSEQEFEAFRDNKEDFSDLGKQKIVLKTLILLAYLKKNYEEIRRKTNLNIYHIPMMLTLTHTVNPKDVGKEPDLVLFFREIEKIAQGKLTNEILERAKAELIEEFERRNHYVFGSESLSINSEALASITYDDILTQVFNSQTFGSIEVLVLPSNKQELAFKLKTSDRPFASVKIGDISGWLKETLSGYEIIERWENESFFERINKDDSDINILMGSRAFYEGWDSNRPNIINFINIGMGTDARKFITQSIGRGSRIEPIKDKRKRINYLRSAKDSEAEKIASIVGLELFNPLETLFIFGTKKDVIREIITTMKEEKLRLGETISLDVNPKAQGVILLIPCYKEMKRIPITKIPKFSVSKESLIFLREYIKWIEDDRILLNLHFSESGSNLDDLIRFKEFVENDEKFIFTNNTAVLVPPSILIQQLVSHVNILTEELEKFKQLEEEIVHFKRIGVFLDENKIKDLRERIEKVKNYPQKKTEEQELDKQYGRIPREEYDKKRSEIEKKYSERENFSFGGKDIGIYYVAEHYYVPLLSTEEKIEWINHIIKTPSEHKFIKDLMEYLKQENNLFKKFDWWMFSKIDEHLDKVHIPYYDGSSNLVRRFKPDFIFWLCKDRDYYILFIDPKGISHTEFGYKVDGYEKIFKKEDNSIKTFQEHGFKIKVFLNLYTTDTGHLPERMYKEYWFDSIHKSIQNLLSC